MAGRPKGMALKVGGLEGDVLALFQRIDAAIPAMHKANLDERKGTGGPWVNFYRAACLLVTAAADLGEHSRKAAGVDEPGPIASALGNGALNAMRKLSTGTRTAGESGIMERLDAMARSGAIPGHAPIRDEIEWVARNLHAADPDLSDAPSVAAVNMLGGRAG